MNARQKFGRYELLRKVATGGMAEVFFGRQVSIGGFEKDVVIKCMLPTLAVDKQFVKMFMREARLAARLNHPNIVQIFDVGLEDEIPFIAMEYVNGHNMRQIYNQSRKLGTPLLIGQAAKIASGVAAGLESAHSATNGDGTPLGIVHQDISPSNVLLGSDGCVKIVDFGIARAVSNPKDSVAGSGVLGKRGYIAPEQIRREKITGRTDIFSLGVLLYEWTTHRPLFLRDSVLLTEQATLDGPILPPSAIIRYYPRALEKIVLRALEREPRRRYRHAGQMHEDLEDFLSYSEHGCSASDLANLHRKLFGKSKGTGAWPSQDTGSAEAASGPGSASAGSAPRAPSEPANPSWSLPWAPTDPAGPSTYLSLTVLILVLVASGLVWWLLL